MDRVLYFYPVAPKSTFALPKMMHLAGVERKDAESPEIDEPIIAWVGDTVWTRPKSKTPKAINFDCTDISKSAVADAFQKAFGYRIDVDPNVYHGELVEKSERNATHDGWVATGPFAYAGEGKVYQRLIDSSDDEGMVTDIRTPIIGNKIPLVYLKRRPVEMRFSNTNLSVTITQAWKIFSQQEIAKIRRFARIIGMDYGELDIIRDRNSGDLFIVDANRTPVGPPNNIEQKTGVAALRTMAGAFVDQFIHGGYWST